MDFSQNFSKDFSTIIVGGLAILLFLNELIRLHYSRQISLFATILEPSVSLRKSIPLKVKVLGFSKKMVYVLGTYMVINGLAIFFLLYLLYAQNWVGAFIFAATKILTPYAVNNKIPGTYFVDKTGYNLPSNFLLLIFSMMRTVVLSQYM